MKSAQGFASRLTQSLGAICAEHLIAEKWLIAPSLRAGNQWVQNVARSGQPAINLRVTTIKGWAIQLAGPALAKAGLSVASRRARAFALDHVLRSNLARLRYLSQMTLNAASIDALISSIDALRSVDRGTSHIELQVFEVDDKGWDLLKIESEYLERLRSENLIDDADLLQIATKQLQSNPDLVRPGSLVLLPADAELKPLQLKLLDHLPADRKLLIDVDSLDKPASDPQSDLARMSWIKSAEFAPPPLDDGTVTIHSAAGAVNEVRAALRHVTAQRIPLDQVEILHTDGETYVPLIYETLLQDNANDSDSDAKVPATFAEGLPSDYSRPARAVVGWLKWIQSDFRQERLSRMVRNGLVNTPSDWEPRDFARVGVLLRELPIGLGRDRYLQVVARQQNATRARVAEQQEYADDADDAKLQQLQQQLTDLTNTEQLLESILRCVPAENASPAEIIKCAKNFVAGLARRVDQFDHYAAQILDEELADMLHWLSLEDQTSIDVWQWLAELPSAARVLGSGPRPGCLHIDNVYSGGHSGRPFTFILGMDDRRFPGASLQDPLLLDGERQRISSEIQTAAARREKTVDDFWRMLARLRGKVWLSYSSLALEDDRETFPSSVLLNVYRLLTARPDADQRTFVEDIPPAFGPAPSEEAASTNMSDWWLWQFTEETQVAGAQQLVHQLYPHLAQGATAQRARTGDVFSEYDGLVPEAGAELDPSNESRAFSASGIQKAAKCPLQYFFSYGLGLWPPEELEIDPETWLDALVTGSLLHELFEQFMRELIDADRLPDYERDHARLIQLLGAKVAEYREKYPPPRESIFEMEVRRLRQAAETFLRDEARLCKREGNVPAYLEASLGMKSIAPLSEIDTEDPIKLELPGGRTILLRGRVDRVDRLGRPEERTFAIWDYKSGSSYPYKQADPHRQGRTLQPFIYVSIVNHRLKEVLGGRPRIEYFGFFFPGHKAVGQRIKWTPEQLAGGAGILQRICELISDGTFTATDDPNDCTFCDYLPVCGDIDAVTKCSAAKMANPANASLRPIVQLRTTP